MIDCVVCIVEVKGQPAAESLDCRDAWWGGFGQWQWDYFV